MEVEDDVLPKKVGLPAAWVGGPGGGGRGCGMAGGARGVGAVELGGGGALGERRAGGSSASSAGRATLRTSLGRVATAGWRAAGAEPGGGWGADGGALALARTRGVARRGSAARIRRPPPPRMSARRRPAGLRSLQTMQLNVHGLLHGVHYCCRTGNLC